ncbi:MAG: plasmid mobilization protein [Halothiobacillaceae bacterium]
MEKLIDQVGVKVCNEDRRRLAALADLAGMSVSEYCRELIMAHLRMKQMEYERMHEVFGTPRNRSTGDGR